VASERTPADIDGRKTVTSIGARDSTEGLTGRFLPQVVCGVRGKEAIGKGILLGLSKTEKSRRGGKTEDKKEREKVSSKSCW